MSELTDVSNQLSSQNRSLRETFAEEHEKARQQADAIGNKLSEIYTHGFENQAKALGRLGSSMASGLSDKLSKSLAFLKVDLGYNYQLQSRDTEAQKLYTEILDQVRENPPLANMVGRSFKNYKLWSQI